MPCFRQSQNSFKKKSVRYHAHTMLTVFPKTCSDGAKPQVPDLTGENAENPGIAWACGVLKCSQMSLKSTGGHCVPTTRNQFAGNCTRVRIPPAAPRLQKHLLLEPFLFTRRILDTLERTLVVALGPSRCKKSSRHRSGAFFSADFQKRSVCSISREKAQ